MGTSSNPSSPNTPPWKPFKAILGDPKWPIERQSEELWQAALADRNGQLRNELGNPLMAEISRLADAGLNVPNTIQAFDSLLTNNSTANLTLDMAKRALIRATASGSGSTGFASELFAETASYYVSRDLPSFVGTPNRVATTSEAIRLKDKFRSIARDQAQTAEVSTSNEGWGSYVSQVLTALLSLTGGLP